MEVEGLKLNFYNCIPHGKNPNTLQSQMQKCLIGLAASIENDGKHDKSESKQGNRGEKRYSFPTWTTQLLFIHLKPFC